MSSRPRVPEPLVRPEFGPTLPALLRERLGIPTPVTVTVVVALTLALVAALLARGGTDGRAQLVHRAAPAFSLLYAPGPLRPATRREGELARLELSRRRVSASVAVRPLRPGAHGGLASFAELPVYATRYADDLRRRLAGFELRDEGKARVNDAPGYQVRFRVAGPGRLTFGHDVLRVPTEDAVRDGVVLSLRQTGAGEPLRAGDLRAVAAAKAAFRSFRFGTERG